jgi:outer membrane protein insertion porin family/translocation and assembly module TamA
MTPRLVAIALVFGMTGCATIPMNRYGVAHVEIEGAEEMGADSIANCLSTTERSRVSIPLGIGEAGPCGEPPFDQSPPTLETFSWFWNDYPLFDRVAFEQDLQRVERWYAARGFHAARVVDSRVEPSQALERDVLPEDVAEPGCERRDDDEGCVVDVTIVVEEGEPTLVEEVRVVGLEGLPDDLREEIESSISMVVGDRFDEWDYDEAKRVVFHTLLENSYALATVEGTARVDRPNRKAYVEIRVSPGVPCVFGEVHVTGYADLPPNPIRAAAGIKAGEPFNESDLEDAQRAIYGLGAFASVLVESIQPTEGNVVDITVSVTPAQCDRLGLGVGIQSGILTKGAYSNDQISVPQWDVHLIARYTHRNFLGGMRQLMIEEIPRLILQEPFPGFTTPRFGNLVSLELRQPGFPEARTDTRFNASYDFGPDPFDTFFRHRIDTSIHVERFFLHLQTLFASLGIHNSIYLVTPGALRANGDAPPSDYILTYLSQEVRVDLRDDSQQPHQGLMAILSVHESGYFLPSSWDYIRLVPDLRAYVPLPLRITLAMRFSLGMYFITEADAGLDAESAALGPRDLRLRGGGASSNRGFIAGRLGDGVDGGTRRWEATVELRVPINNTIGTVLFADAGDVSRAETFRFDHPQVSVGAGIRIFTPIGSIRWDIAGRIPGLQVLADVDQRNPGAQSTNACIFDLCWPGATHITIGESF